MFTIETEFDYTVITSLDEEDNFPDLEVLLDEELVYMSQHDAETGQVQILELSYQQLMDIVTAIDLPEGAYYVTPKGRLI